MLSIPIDQRSREYNVSSWKEIYLICLMQLVILIHIKKYCFENKVRVSYSGTLGGGCSLAVV